MAKKKTHTRKQQTPINSKPEKPTIVIPLTPVSNPTEAPLLQRWQRDKTNSPDADDPEAYSTPPTSAETPPPKLFGLPVITDNKLDQGINHLVMAGTIFSPDVFAIAEFYASMKNTLQCFSSAFDRVEYQCSQMNQFGRDVQAEDKLSQLRVDLDDHIHRQKGELEDVKRVLESKVEEALAERLRSELYASIQSSVAQVIEERVRHELIEQIPGNLRQQVLGHQRQILEVKTNLHNSEARRYNASLQSASLTAPLRPLLRPLPTPEQSPIPIIITTSAAPSTLNSPLPFSAFPHAPAPTPIKRSTSMFSISRSQSFQPTPPIPSALFPRDLKSLFALGPDAAKTLLREYGLDSTAPSPIAEEAKHKAPTSQAPSSTDSIPEEGESEDEDVSIHVQDMNKFMAHIGVPFLMIPPPKSKETNVERRRKLAPLIINTSPGVH